MQFILQDDTIKKYFMKSRWPMTRILADCNNKLARIRWRKDDHVSGFQTEFLLAIGSSIMFPTYL